MCVHVCVSVCVLVCVCNSVPVCASVLLRLYTCGGVCVRGDVCVRQVCITIWAVVCVSLVRVAHPHPDHRSRCHRGHGGCRGNGV